MGTGAALDDRRRVSVLVSMSTSVISSVSSASTCDLVAWQRSSSHYTNDSSSRESTRSITIPVNPGFVSVAPSPDAFFSFSGIRQMPAQRHPTCQTTSYVISSLLADPVTDHFHRSLDSLRINSGPSALANDRHAQVVTQAPGPAVKATSSPPLLASDARATPHTYSLVWPRPKAPSHPPAEERDAFKNSSASTITTYCVRSCLTGWHPAAQSQSDGSNSA